MGRLLESFLNHELPELLEEGLSAGERVHSFQTRKVMTALGPIQLRRAYVRGPRRSRFPLDELLGLHQQYTPTVVQLMCWAGAMDSSFDIASETLERFAGLRIPGRQIQRIVNDFGPDAAVWMHKREVPVPTQPVEVLNIQTDMTGIPARPEELEGIRGKQDEKRAKTRQIKVGCIFTQSRGAEGEAQRNPSSSRYLAAFCDRVDFGQQLWQEAIKQGYGTARATVFLGDGAEWIWNLAGERFPDAVQIVDYYHACEHLHALCHVLETNEKKAAELYARWKRRLKNNGIFNMIKETKKRLTALRPAARKVARAELAYFEKNLHRMKYRTFRRKGYFIGSGAVEGACRHIVAQRAKLSGMRWSCKGAENVLTFRCLIKSGIFDDYAKQIKNVA